MFTAHGGSMRSILVTLLAGALICPAAVHGQAAKARKARKPAASKAASKAKPSKAEASEKAAEQFQAFCQDWMQKLAVRERDNISHIKWNTKPDGVEGEYVGYIQEHTCSVKADGQAPVGRVMYQE